MDQAIHWYLRVATQGYATGQFDAAGILDQRLDKDPQNYRRVLDLTMQAPCQGLARAQHDLGFIFQEGINSQTRNIKKSFNFYLKAAAQDFAQSYVNAGLIIQAGYEGLKSNPVLAQELFMKSADLGNPRGTHCAGVNFVDGFESQPPDYGQALKLYLKTAHLGFSDSKINAAVLIFQSYGVKHHLIITAINLLLEPAKAGIVQTQFNLGSILLERSKLLYQEPGESYYKMQKNALSWLYKAAEKDYTMTIVLLAHYFIDINAEPTTVLFWIEKAKSLDAVIMKEHLDYIDRVNELQENVENDAILQTEKQALTWSINLLFVNNNDHSIRTLNKDSLDALSNNTALENDIK